MNFVGVFTDSRQHEHLDCVTRVKLQVAPNAFVNLAILGNNVGQNRDHIFHEVQFCWEVFHPRNDRILRPESQVSDNAELQVLVIHKTKLLKPLLKQLVLRMDFGCELLGSEWQV